MTPEGDTLRDLRALLFDTIRKVRSGEVDVSKARAVNDLGRTLIDTGKLEVDYMREARDVVKSAFLESPQSEDGALPNGITGIVRHRLLG